MINIFEQIKKVNEFGYEYWSARALCKLLGYTEYGKFLPAIERAKSACNASLQAVNDHFAEVSEMIKIASGTDKETLRKEVKKRLKKHTSDLQLESNSESDML